MRMRSIRLAAFFAVACGFATLLYVLSLGVDRMPAPQSPPAVREEPLIPDVVPLGGRRGLDTRRLSEAIAALEPNFNLTRLPAPLVVHATRLWGAGKRFTMPAPGGRGVVSAELISIMLDDDSYKKYTKYIQNSLIERSEFGVQVASDLDFDSIRSRASSHVGKYQDTLAKIGMPASTKLHLAGGEVAVLGDTVVDEAMRFHLDVQIEWSVQALASYLGQSRWTNRFGEVCSFDAAAIALLDRPLGSGTCNGIHTLHALATIYSLDDTAKLVSGGTKEKIRGRLHEASDLLTRTQGADGSWDAGWHDEDRARSLHEIAHSYWKVERIRKLSAVGHHLEWMLIVPADCRPADAVMWRAVDYAVANLPAVAPDIESDWHNYLPASHAARALLLVSSRGRTPRLRGGQPAQPHP